MPIKRSLHNYRRLHLIDIENLAGGPGADRARVKLAFRAYEQAAAPEHGDHVVLGCGPNLAPVAWFAGLGGCRRVLGRGVDGANRALAEAVPRPHIVHCYQGVVIGSGNSFFAPLAGWLTENGCLVEVVARRGTISWQLARAASEVHVLPSWSSAVTTTAVAS